MHFELVKSVDDDRSTGNFQRYLAYLGNKSLRTRYDSIWLLETNYQGKSGKQTYFGYLKIVVQYRSDHGDFVGGNVFMMMTGPRKNLVIFNSFKRQGLGRGFGSTASRLALKQKFVFR